MSGTLEELSSYLDSEGNKKESKQFRTGKIRTFLREYYREYRADINNTPDHYISLHEIYLSYTDKNCKESYFNGVARKAYPTILRNDVYFIDLSRQKITKTRRPST